MYIYTLAGIYLVDELPGFFKELLDFPAAIRKSSDQIGL